MLYRGGRWHIPPQLSSTSSPGPEGRTGHPCPLPLRRYALLSPFRAVGKFSRAPEHNATRGSLPSLALPLSEAAQNTCSPGLPQGGGRLQAQSPALPARTTKTYAAGAGGDGSRVPQRGAGGAAVPFRLPVRRPSPSRRPPPPGLPWCRHIHLSRGWEAGPGHRVAR